MLLSSRVAGCHHLTRSVQANSFTKICKTNPIDPLFATKPKENEAKSARCPKSHSCRPHVLLKLPQNTKKLPNEPNPPCVFNKTQRKRTQMHNLPGTSPRTRNFTPSPAVILHERVNNRVKLVMNKLVKNRPPEASHV